MARRRKGVRVNKTISAVVFAAALIAVILGRFNDDFETVHEPAVTLDPAASAVVKVHFIDVGQGNSILIQSAEKGVLIDAGTKQYAGAVTRYLKKNGVTKLSCVIATHPHSDHIGALPYVLGEFPTDNIIMPRLTEINMPTTETYKDLLLTVSQKKIKAIEAKEGSTYNFGSASIRILGPVVQSRDLNNMSVVCEVTAYKTKFMLLADAEKPELADIFSTAQIGKCDVLQMGHHGSDTSLFYPLLDRLSPEHAVIFCGKDNTYGLPSEETISYLKSKKIKYYRTDVTGSVVFSCGENGFGAAAA